MAIIQNLVTRRAKQSAGGLTFYQLKGQTVMREKVSTVSNPRSNAQMIQRARLKNSVAFYQANRFWMESGAFQSKKDTWSDYNAFVSVNQAVNPAFLTKDATAAGGGLILPYTVTKGSLPSVKVSYLAVDRAVTDLYVRTSMDGLTVAELTNQLLENNNRLEEGMQLSVIVNYQEIDSVTGTPTILARAYELILDTNDNVRVLDRIPALEGVSTDNGLVLGIALDSFLSAVTFIISSGSGSNIKVSTQQMVLSPQLISFVSAYYSDNSFNAYVESYGTQAATDFLATGYSNGASSNVPVPIQIVSVNGVEPGGYLQIPNAETAGISIVLSGAPTNAGRYLAEAEMKGYNVVEEWLLEDMDVIGNTVVAQGASIPTNPDYRGRQIHTVKVTIPTGDGDSDYILVTADFLYDDTIIGD